MAQSEPVALQGSKVKFNCKLYDFPEENAMLLYHIQ